MLVVATSVVYSHEATQCRSWLTVDSFTVALLAHSATRVNTVCLRTGQLVPLVCRAVHFVFHDRQLIQLMIS